MKLFKVVTLAAFILPTAVFSATPPTVTAGPELCSNIQWSADFLARYPKAAAACRSISVRNGVKYAQFDGKVSKVGTHFVQVQILDVANYPMSLIAFEIGVGGRVTLGDKTEMVKDLRVDDTVTFWVRENQFGISPTLADEPMRIIQPDALPAG